MTERSDATLTVTPLPHLGKRAKLVTLDCRHGRTEGLLLVPERPRHPAPEWESIRYMLLSHASHGCHCTKALRRRYGLERRQGP